MRAQRTRQAVGAEEGLPGAARRLPQVQAPGGQAAGSQNPFIINNSPQRSKFTFQQGRGMGSPTTALRFCAGGPPGLAAPLLCQIVTC